MERVDLGLRMQQWHSSQNDPIYAVGSFYFDNTVYPQKDIVESAIQNLESDLSKMRRMSRGEKVSASTAYGTTNDLRKFAGYKTKELRENIRDLREIVSELKRFLKEDYT